MTIMNYSLCLHSSLFQSLFQWILYYDKTGLCSVSSTPSFNPCFSGSYIMTESVINYVARRSLFQSLFQWILYYDQPEYKRDEGKLMFQSLFQWILYYDLNKTREAYLQGQFQSLFQWILYYDPKASPAACHIGWFQSLFQWILYYDSWPYASSYYIAFSFNPCFSGSYIMTRPGGCNL